VRVSGKDQFFISQPEIAVIQQRDAFAKKWQSALTIHFNRNSVAADFDLSIIINECVIQRLSSVVRIPYSD